MKAVGQGTPNLAAAPKLAVANSGRVERSPQETGSRLSSKFASMLPSSKVSVASKCMHGPVILNNIVLQEIFLCYTEPCKLR